MREILFRGKRIDNGEWVCGLLLTNKMGSYIVTEENPHECTQYGYIKIDGYYRVDPKTIGQLIDGVFVYGYGGVDPICRGDIIGFPYEGQDIVGWVEVEFGIPIIVSLRLEDGFICLSEVLEVDEDQAVFKGRWLGNIHDNPELLGV